MPEGGCFCNKIRLSYTGEPNDYALCHCLDCRKIGGASYSNNLTIPEQNFKLHSGTPAPLLTHPPRSITVQASQRRSPRKPIVARPSRPISAQTVEPHFSVLASLSQAQSLSRQAFWMIQTSRPRMFLRLSCLLLSVLLGSHLFRELLNWMACRQIRLGGWWKVVVHS